MQTEAWWWRHYREHGAWIADRLFQFICYLLYRNETVVPKGITFDNLARLYAEGNR